MSPLWSALALVVGLGIIARLLIVNASKREETLAEKRLRQRIAEDEFGGQILGDQGEPKRGRLGRNRRSARKAASVTAVASWLEGTPLLKDDEGQTFIDRVRKDIVLAGLEHKYSPYELLALALVIWGAGILGTTGLLFAGLIPKLLYVPAVAIAAVYPLMRLRSLKRRRADSVKAETIVFIMQLRMALSSGMSTIDDALARMARQAEIDPYDSILANEFGRAINKVRVGGAEWEEAMREVSERLEVLSVTNLVESLIQGRRMGSDMSHILEEYGRSASELWQQDMRTLKARKEPMITIGMVITLFGGFILIAGPMMISLMRTMSIVGGGGP
jgi:Flp pilus assembly protein TadB